MLRRACSVGRSGDSVLPALRLMFSRLVYSMKVGFLGSMEF